MRPSARGAVLGVLRSRGRRVIWTFPGVNLGNFLYLWQSASTARSLAAQGTLRAARRRDAVLLQESVLPWLDVFPSLRELSVTRDEVGFLDRRELEKDHSELGVDFDTATLSTFCHERLLSAPLLAGAPEGDPEELVINIRRGDYYSVPRFRALYGFDQVGYVRRALARSTEEHGAPRRIRVVSDGLGWCQQHLSWLTDHAPTRFGADDDTPAGHLRQIARARRLIITNSSFSYWGAYLATQSLVDPSVVVAPLLHRRGINEGRAWQLHPRWTVLDDPASRRVEPEGLAP